MVRVKTLLLLSAVGLILLVGVQLSQTACSNAEILTTTSRDDLNPRWSPDGTKIAFVGHHEGNPDVYVLDVSTHAVTNLSHSPFDDYNPIWSPDGQYLVFFHRQQPYAKEYILPWLAHVESGVITEISAEPRFLRQDGVHWSADSQKIELTGYPDTLHYDLTTKTIRIEKDTQIQAYAQIQNAVSPDGLVAWAEASSTRNGLPYRLLFSDNPASKPHQLLQLDIPFTMDSWSPMREQVAFYSYAGVYVLDVPTGNFRDFIQGIGKIMTVNWSSDGNYVASLIAAPTGGKIAVSDLRSGALCTYGKDYRWFRYIHFDKNESIRGEPQWSPTNDQLVFSSGVSGNSNLILLTMQG
jgi:Tol biopolymer transport system component